MKVKTSHVTDAALHTVFTADADVVASVYVCNTGADVLTCTLWIGSGNGPSAGQRVECGANIPAGGVLERSGLPLIVGETVFFQATATCSADIRVCGL